jgi:hypothetical protein
MKTTYDIAQLIKQVHNQMGDALTSNDIEDLLTISEDAYYKDSPLSVGKRLSLKSIEFKGVKVYPDMEQPIHYRREFQTGVNLWVGDNLVGKSSIFKIIKLALTGNNRISRDVASWLAEIWVEFSLGSNVYFAYINRDKNKPFHFALYNGNRSMISVVGAEQTDSCLFEGGLEKYKDYLQTFFFRELAYYSLQWTQRDSRPGNPELLTSGASWSTYYKSVFLEAEDYSMLFIGNQSELIFQMLLGLELTYPINRLKIKRNHLANLVGIAKAAPATPEQESGQGQRLADQQELTQINSELSSLDAEAKQVTEAPSTNTEQTLEIARQAYRNALHQRAELEAERDALTDQVGIMWRRINALTRQVDDYDVDINKKKRRIGDIQEILDLGAFFSSLEVRICPNCNHTVDQQKVVHEKNTGNCRLCEQEVDHQPVDKDAYSHQIKQLEQQRQTLFNDQYRLRVERARVEDEHKKASRRQQTIGEEIASLQIERLQKEQNRLQQNFIAVQPPPFDWTAHISRVAALSARKAILEQTIQTPVASIVAADAGYAFTELQIKAIELAEQLLQQERDERSRSLIETFESLYLKQLHSFGLTHYERVEVKANFKVAYYMRGDEYSFDEITAGEKLRAKLGLYIALIELDVQHQLGRHPRFLVLDSPAREEGDHAYVEGLKTTLAYVQERFGNDLQVFVGTAQRELISAVDAEQVEVKAEKEYFF